MRNRLLVLTLACLTVAGCTIGSNQANHIPAPATEWVPLFDGATLNGWHVACRPEDAGKGFWKVDNGAITCDSRGRKDHHYVWLVSDREYGDFELKLKVRGFRDSAGNSGVQIRSRYDEEAGWMNGPQVDVHPPAPWRTGLVYDETWETRHWIYPRLSNARIDESYAPENWTWKYADEGDGWNSLQIRCRGPRIKTVVNGNVITDRDFSGILDDEAHRAHNVGLRGHIALQLHNKDELYIQYKDIAIKVLE